MYIMEESNAGNGKRFRMSNGRVVIIGDHQIGFEDGHPSNIDYYYDSERGYGCATEREAALVFASQTAEWDRVL